MPQTTASTSRFKRWTLLVGSALILGYLFGRLGAAWL